MSCIISSLSVPWHCILLHLPYPTITHFPWNCQGSFLSGSQIIWSNCLSSWKPSTVPNGLQRSSNFSMHYKVVGWSTVMTRGVTDIWSNIFWMCLWGCFWIRLTFELADWIVNQLFWPLNGGQPHPVQDLNRIKILCKKQFLLPDWTGTMGFPGGSDGKESACNEGELGLIPGLGRSPGEGHRNPLQ